MPAMNEPRFYLESALYWRRQGYPVATMDFGKKFTTEKGARALTIDEITERMRHELRNIGCVLRELDLAVVDVDGQRGERFLADQGIKGKLQIQTSRGIHHYFRNCGLTRNRLKFLGIEIDVLVNNITPLPPSWNEAKNWRYNLLTRPVMKPAELSLLPSLFLEDKKTIRFQDREMPAGEGNIFNPEAYCLKITSVQGSHGSKALWRVAQILKTAGRSPQQAWEFMVREWNHRCATPPWPEASIYRVISRSYGL